MPWNDNANNGGGPWGSSGGGSGGKNPWGQGPRGGGSGGGGGGQRPPDFDKAFRDARERFKGFGGGKGGGLAVVVFIVVALVAWGLTGVYFVQPQEQGVELRFGKYSDTTQPGIQYHFPWPIERAFTPEVTRVQRVNIGYEDARGEPRDISAESLMLTQDENIVDIDFSVFWVINDARDFLFNVEDPEGTVKAVAESAMREVVGNNQLEPIITRGRQVVEQDARQLMQATLDEYGAGIQVRQVQLQKADPPERVIESFRDVVNAAQDAETIINRATAYRNQIVPEARGTASQIVQEAEAYREQVVADSSGQAQRFTAVLSEYQQAPEVTRQRMYLETLERVMQKADKIVIDGETAEGVVPYLPLNELNRNRADQGGQQ
ncbi:FtsH protease activity modulator HflK [Euryhalocaulis caribicus]|uniref:FtsH protease activity modulator HflK n=1 Tax=Euryhalocaulis caribicus TaxID=1161401 RepID=UPI00039EA6AF|nr:FtsH protease activity modulator HflK [Euryhalocaulis caribicus]